ncbi:MAG: sugar phosphate isomerase/epimerase family protein [Planctomycetota bacterium]
MTPAIDRRSFLKHSVAGVTGLTGLSCAGHPRAPQPQGDAVLPATEQPLPLSLAQWSLHRRLKGRVQPHLDPLDFAATARGLGFEAIEYVNQFFMDKAADRAYLADLKTRAADQGVKSLLIMCDAEGALGDPDDGRRRQAIENHHKWVEAAVFLGCHSIRVNAQSSGDAAEQARLAADGLARLTEFAATHECNVLVENHGGLSSNGAWLAGVMRQVDDPRCGTLPDFGNFHIGDGEWYDRYQGVRELMPFAKAVSAKSHAFDDAGNETKTDYRQMLQIVWDAGYRGWVGIEYEGSELSEDKGVLATKALLERVRGEIIAAERGADSGR